MHDHKYAELFGETMQEIECRDDNWVGFEINAVVGLEERSYVVIDKIAFPKNERTAFSNPTLKRCSHLEPCCYIFTINRIENLWNIDMDKDCLKFLAPSTGFGENQVRFEQLVITCKNYFFQNY